MQHEHQTSKKNIIVHPIKEAELQVFTSKLSTTANHNYQNGNNKERKLLPCLNPWLIQWSRSQWEEGAETDMHGSLGHSVAPNSIRGKEQKLQCLDERPASFRDDLLYLKNSLVFLKETGDDNCKKKTFKEFCKKEREKTYSDSW